MTIIYILSTKSNVPEEFVENLKKNKNTILCSSNNELKSLLYEKHNDSNTILYPKVGRLSYLEEDLLLSYKGYKKLFLFNDPLMFDSWTFSLFNEVYLFDHNTKLFSLIKYNINKTKSFL